MAKQKAQKKPKTDSQPGALDWRETVQELESIKDGLRTSTVSLSRERLEKLIIKLGSSTEGQIT